MREEWEILIKTTPAEELQLIIWDFVDRKIAENPQYAELDVAINRILDEVGFYDNRLYPDDLLVRAGVLPESVLWDPVELPNGETAKLYKNMQIVVKYRTRGKKTEEGLRMIAEAEKEEMSILERLSGGVTEDEMEPLLSELETIQKRLEALRTPVYFDKERKITKVMNFRGPGAPAGEPKLKVVVMNLGLIERKEE